MVFFNNLLPSFGVSSANSLAKSVPGVKTGAPSGVKWTTWAMLPPPLRYFSRRSAIALRVDDTFSVLR